MAIERDDINRDENRDPITGEPGAHPVGVGVGAAGGGAAGAAIGAVAGPIGAAVGAVIGAVAGGLAGKGVAEAVDPTAEDAYWREHHRDQPYAAKEHTYDTYAPAYRTGYEGFSKYEPGTRFEDAEPTLRQDYETHLKSRPATATTAAATTATGKAQLGWDKAKHAAQAAWQRVERGEAVRVPLAEEQVNVGKREVESGNIRVRKVVKTETVTQPVNLKQEKVEIERVTPTTPTAAPQNAFREQEIEVPLKREEAVVEKNARVTGEVRVKKNAETETHHVQEQVRKEDIRVEKEGQARIEKNPKNRPL